MNTRLLYVPDEDRTDSAPPPTRHFAPGVAAQHRGTGRRPAGSPRRHLDAVDAVQRNDTDTYSMPPLPTHYPMHYVPDEDRTESVSLPTRHFAQGVPHLPWRRASALPRQHSPHVDAVKRGTTDTCSMPPIPRDLDGGFVDTLAGRTQSHTTHRLPRQSGVKEQVSPRSHFPLPPFPEHEAGMFHEDPIHRPLLLEGTTGDCTHVDRWGDLITSTRHADATRSLRQDLAPSTPGPTRTLADYLWCSRNQLPSHPEPDQAPTMTRSDSQRQLSTLLNRDATALVREELRPHSAQHFEGNVVATEIHREGRGITLAQSSVGGYAYPSEIPPYPTRPRHDFDDISPWPPGWNSDLTALPHPVRKAVLSSPSQTGTAPFPTRKCLKLRTVKSLAPIAVFVFALAPINLMMCKVSATSANWFHLLAWLLVGFPALLFTWACMAPRVVRISNPSSCARACSFIMLSAVIGLVAGFFYGLSEAKVKAAKDYLRPEQFAKVSCWQAPQVDIVHPGRMHFIQLVDEDWSIDCGWFNSVKHPEGNHYFSTAPLRYTGRAGLNCPHAYHPVCYSTHAPTCSSMKESCFLNHPPNTVLLQVVNQNEQFFQALPAEEEDQYRRMIPDLAAQFVIFGTDEGPEYYEDKYNYHSRVAYLMWATAAVLQAVIAMKVARAVHAIRQRLDGRADNVQFSFSAAPKQPPVQYTHLEYLL